MISAVTIRFGAESDCRSFPTEVGREGAWEWNVLIG